MAATYNDFKKLTQMRFSAKEVTLTDVVASIKRGSKRYTLKRSTQYTSTFQLWDTVRDEVVVCTHAFVILYATPLDTGNYCPDGAAPPMEFKGQMRKTEPSLAAQVSLTFDTRVEPSLHEDLSVLEEWGKTKGGFNTESKSRNPWNSPLAVATQNRFTISSSLFQKRTGFNVTDDKYVVDYDVHPWIAQACVPHNPAWIPNPSLARFLHRKPNDVLVDILGSSNPKLVPGDMVVATFKITFSAAGSYWQMAFMPIQVIRMGQISPQVLGSAKDPEDRVRLDLPRVGERLKVFKAGGDVSREVSPEINERGGLDHGDELEEDGELTVSGSDPEEEEEPDREPALNLGRSLPREDSQVERKSSSWASITPPGGSPLTPAPESPIVSDHEVVGEPPLEYVRLTVRAKSAAKAEPVAGSQHNRDGAKASASAEITKTGGGKGTKRSAPGATRKGRAVRSKTKE
ncbi:hypothetical protein DFP72DRAFT_1078729 [Ephemerocybe angulata]|uniref:Uncharacterized protein n=1 Tax=Ephemerocybe angulata TaxID=980116 RepID=A0A8H6LX29_9AGAR|nr:hypothetical protein DFP72DRAFT_1078729 [Tulosesus angulatus]